MRNRRELPYVDITNNNVYYEIANWLMVCDYEVERCMQVILSNLGYECNDSIVINKCYMDEADNKYLELLVNKTFVNRICIFNCDMNDYPYIKLGRDENGWEFYYQVIIYDRNNIDLNMYKYSNIVGDIIYNYESTKEWVEYKIEDGGYSLEFRIAKPVRLISEFGGYRKYEVDNEKDLINYLLGLDFSKSLLDIYSDICKISLGNDMNKYGFIDLRLIKCVCNEDGIIDDMVTDLICLENGKLISLIITKDDKQIWYDQNDTSAEYIYDTDLMQVKLSICDKDNGIDFNTKLRYKNNRCIGIDSYNKLEEANREISKVRKLVHNINFCRDNV